MNTKTLFALGLLLLISNAYSMEEQEHHNRRQQCCLITAAKRLGTAVAVVSASAVCGVVSAYIFVVVTGNLKNALGYDNTIRFGSGN